MVDVSTNIKHIYSHCGPDKHSLRMITESEDKNDMFAFRCRKDIKNQQT